MGAGMALGRGDLSGRGVVIFDFDGTLADTVDSIVAVAREVMVDHGYPEERLGDMRRLVGPPFPQAFSQVYGVTPEEAVSITADYRVRYRAIGAAAWPFYEGMADLLARLRAAGRRTAIASSKRAELLAQAISDNEAEALFDVCCGKLSDEGDSKAKAIVRALEALGASADDAVMVGDRHYDVEAAIECGIPCVGVSYGGTCEEGELEGAGAAVVVGSVDELGRVLLGDRP